MPREKTPTGAAWVRKFSWRREWLPTPVFLPEEFHEQRSLVGQKSPDTPGSLEGNIPWTARRSNQSILKEISPGISLEEMMLKLKLQYFGHLMRRVDSLEKTLMLGGIGGRRRRGRHAGLCGRCTGVAVPLRVVPSPTGLPSKRRLGAELELRRSGSSLGPSQ